MVAGVLDVAAKMKESEEILQVLDHAWSAEDEFNCFL